MTTNYFIRLVIPLIFLLLISDSENAYSNTHFSNQDCQHYSSFSPWLDNKASVHYYIQSSFSSQLNSCISNSSSPPHWAGYLTQSNAQTIIQNAAEIWNSESRSVALLNAGHINIAEINTNNCSLFKEKPAVFIQFNIAVPV